MSDNQGGKLKLNLAAKEFKPKYLQQQQNQNQQNVQNPYMGYDMSSPYGYMNYQNQFGMMPNNPYGMPYGGYGFNQNNPGYMNQPQFQNDNFQQPQQPSTQNTPAQTSAQKNDDDGIVGLKMKKKNKKKKGDAQNQGSSNNAAQNQPKVTQVQNQFNQMNLGNNQGQNQKKQQKPKEKIEKEKEKQRGKKRRKKRKKRKRFIFK